MEKCRKLSDRQRSGLLWALGMTALLFAAIAVRFDFYYDLNDDVLIKDILSGVYSGTPDGHTMQLLYPLGFLLSLLYRGLSIPVFGVFLVLCQFGSIFLIGYRTALRCEKWQEKALFLAAEGFFWFAAFGWHLVFIQYTVTAGMLAGAAIFWFLTSDGQGQGAAGFMKKNLPALVLYWTAFCLRSEMALLLLPLAGVAGLCKWGRESKVFTKENVCKYPAVFGALALGLVLCLGLDNLAYSAADWTAFRQFFDERTELYDYQKDFIDNYEDNAEAYEALGVTKAQHALLANYNFGADDSIDESLFAKLKEAAVLRPESGGFFKKSLAEGLWSLRVIHWLGSQDFPYNFVFLICGVLALSLWFGKGRKYLLWQVPLCFAAGAALWMFLLLRDRLADRVFHPLYLGQILVFAGLLLLERENDRSGKESKEEDSPAKMEKLPVAPGHLTAGAAAVLVLCACLIQTPKTWAFVSAEYARREEVNRTWETVMDYCSAHPERLYLEDVYSTVDYSEKITVDRNKPFNYDILGGWLVKSPLTKEKLSAFGFSTMGEAVAAGGNVSLLDEEGSGMEWLTDYFAEKEIPVRVVKTGTIADGVEVYQVVPKDSGERLE
ncbi:MAG: hypothetical protein Q4C58_06725 [Eubacteriales bacterium]|nr:hypothetical protein [Eubacteriales bacterium]